MLLQTTDSSRASQPGRSHPREDGRARINALRRPAAVAAARQNLAAEQAGPHVDEGPGRRCVAQMSRMGCISANCPLCPGCQLPHHCCVLRHSNNQWPNEQGEAGSGEPLERPPECPRRGARQQQQPQQQHANARSRRSRQRERAKERERTKRAERFARVKAWSEAQGLFARELRERATREASAKLFSLALRFREAQAAQRRPDASLLGSSAQPSEETSKAAQVGKEDGQPTIPVTSGSNGGSTALPTDASGVEGEAERRRHPNWSPPSPIRFPGQTGFNNITRPSQDCIMPQDAPELDFAQDSGMGQSFGMGSNDTDDRMLSTPTFDDLSYSPEVSFDK